MNLFRFHDRGRRAALPRPEVLRQGRRTNEGRQRKPFRMHQRANRSGRAKFQENQRQNDSPVGDVVFQKRTQCVRNWGRRLYHISPLVVRVKFKE